ncbi:putative zinc metalloprotease [Flagelloscypha sp. PMI_526]|nr:putative zinc metalloprotease [Flagelloscypha sp. PMI_526]
MANCHLTSRAWSEYFHSSSSARRQHLLIFVQALQIQACILRVSRLLAVMSPFLLFTALAAAFSKAIAQSQWPPLEEYTWPPGPGSLLIPQYPTPELAGLLKSIDPSRIQNTIEKLVSFGTRSTISNQTDPERGIGAARTWIEQELKSYGGRLNVSVEGYTQPGGVNSRVPNDTFIANVFATLTGSEEPDRVYLVSGHYDSRCTDILDGVSDAPGANDDASGVAVSLELARIFADTTPKATIIFVAVAGEEQGLLGSAYLAQQLKAAGKDVQGMLNNDIVGSSKGGNGREDAGHIRMFLQSLPPTLSQADISNYIKIGAENDGAIRQLGRFIVEVTSNDITGIQVEPVYRPDRFLRGGDHSSFIDQGFPAVRFTEPNENYAHQHQDVRFDNATGIQYGDLIEFVDIDYVSRIAKMNGAALFSLANAPGIPKSVKIDTSSLVLNSTIKWTLDTSASLEKYEIVWRPTEMPHWTHVVVVGKVGSATVDLSKDNVQFGVRAVGVNGYKSPAVAPFP